MPNGVPWARCRDRPGRRVDPVPGHPFPLIDAERPAQVYRLGSRTPVAASRCISRRACAGKAQPPHDDTTRAIIVGVEGNERNGLYRREKTADPARDAPRRRARSTGRGRAWC